MAALAADAGKVTQSQQLSKLFGLLLVGTLGKTGVDDMKRVLAIGMVTFLAGLLAGRAAAQDGGGSFVPKDSIWKKGDVLRTSVNVEQIRFSPSGRVAVLASEQGVSVWDWTRDKEARYFSFPKGTKLACLALRDEGKLLATGHVDSSRVLVWNFESGELKQQLNHGAPVRALAFSADGASHLFGDGQAKSWGRIEGGGSHCLGQNRSVLIRHLNGEQWPGSSHARFRYVQEFLTPAQTAKRQRCVRDVGRGDRRHGAVRPSRRREPQAERRLRPRARRAAITLRPPTVAMRARKP